MNNLIENTNKIFEDIKHIAENGNEYWCARELKKALYYTQWRRFENIIDKVKNACKESSINIGSILNVKQKIIN